MVKNIFRNPEWHHLPGWTKGMLIGGVVGIIILILSTWYVTTTGQSSSAIYLPVFLLLLSIAIGAIVGHNQKN